jgi:16S rRNA (cytidine1402-2'-O)-methyltransferase
MGTLYLVATPIGNLADLSARAAQVLRDADAILAEDTRVSRILLARAGAAKIPEPYHDFNKERATPAVIARLKNRGTIALITDAGTPGIADPAFYLARAAIAQSIPVVAVPGPCALLTALTASGLPTDRFVFENFLPVKSGARRRALESFRNEPRTVIFYETPHRIVTALKAMDEVLGDVLVVIGRELTKVHEEYLRGSPRQLIEMFRTKPPRGEMTVLFNTRMRVREQ